VTHGLAFALRAQRSCRRQVAPGTVTAESEAFAIDPEAGGVARNPAQYRRTVVNGAGKARFGRTPVIHGDDRATTAVREPVADRIVRIEVPEHEPAPVTEHDDGQTGGHRGPIDAHVQRTCGAR